MKKLFFLLFLSGMFSANALTCSFTVNNSTSSDLSFEIYQTLNYGDDTTLGTSVLNQGVIAHSSSTFNVSYSGVNSFVVYCAGSQIYSPFGSTSCVDASGSSYIFTANALAGLYRCFGFHSTETLDISAYVVPSYRFSNSNFTNYVSLGSVTFLPSFNNFPTASYYLMNPSENYSLSDTGFLTIVPQVDTGIKTLNIKIGRYMSPIYIYNLASSPTNTNVGDPRAIRFQWTTVSYVSGLPVIQIFHLSQSDGHVFSLGGYNLSGYSVDSGYNKLITGAGTDFVDYPIYTNNDGGLHIVVAFISVNDTFTPIFQMKYSYSDLAVTGINPRYFTYTYLDSTNDNLSTVTNSMEPISATNIFGQVSTNGLNAVDPSSGQNNLTATSPYGSATNSFPKGHLGTATPSSGITTGDLNFNYSTNGVPLDVNNTVSSASGLAKDIQDLALEYATKKACKQYDDFAESTKLKDLDDEQNGDISDILTDGGVSSSSGATYTDVQALLYVKIPDMHRNLKEYNVDPYHYFPSFFNFLVLCEEFALYFSFFWMSLNHLLPTLVDGAKALGPNKPDLTAVGCSIPGSGYLIAWGRSGMFFVAYAALSSAVCLWFYNVFAFAVMSCLPNSFAVSIPSSWVHDGSMSVLTNYSIPVSSIWGYVGLYFPITGFFSILSTYVTFRLLLKSKVVLEFLGAYFL